MDRERVQRAIDHHGLELLGRLREENKDNQTVMSLMPPPLLRQDCSGTQSSERDPDAAGTTVAPLWLQNRMLEFVARKADLLFSASWKPGPERVDGAAQREEAKIPMLPPLETLMGVPSVICRQALWSAVKPGALFLGSVSAVREFGLLLRLICSVDLPRDINTLGIVALCPLREMPPHGRQHNDTLDYYRVGDMLQVVLKAVDTERSKFTVSLLPSLLPAGSCAQLGLVNEDAFPRRHRCALGVWDDPRGYYEDVLHSSLGFPNPGAVDWALYDINVSDSHPPSLLRGLQRDCFMPNDFAESLRSHQSERYAQKCVQTGVAHFRAGRLPEAMTAYTEALEIDRDNVDALVARGALYANKGALARAIKDFEEAVKAGPAHRNARRYLVQTLIAHAVQLEGNGEVQEALSNYDRACRLDPGNEEASRGAVQLRKELQAETETKSGESSVVEHKDGTEESSAKKLRRLLKAERRLKKRKRKRSLPSPSLSPSVSTSDSSPRVCRTPRRPQQRARDYRRSSSEGEGNEDGDGDALHNSEAVSSEKLQGAEKGKGGCPVTSDNGKTYGIHRDYSDLDSDPDSLKEGCSLSCQTSSKSELIKCCSESKENFKQIHQLQGQKLSTKFRPKHESCEKNPPREQASEALIDVTTPPQTSASFLPKQVYRAPQSPHETSTTHSSSSRSSDRGSSLSSKRSSSRGSRRRQLSSSSESASPCSRRSSRGKSPVRRRYRSTIRDASPQNSRTPPNSARALRSHSPIRRRTSSSQKLPPTHEHRSRNRSLSSNHYSPPSRNRHSSSAQRSAGSDKVSAGRATARSPHKQLASQPPGRLRLVSASYESDLSNSPIASHRSQHAPSSKSHGGTRGVKASDDLNSQQKFVVKKGLCSQRGIEETNLGKGRGVAANPRALGTAKKSGVVSRGWSLGAARGVKGLGLDAVLQQIAEFEREKANSQN
uniref:tetratricopeptide repeat protein 14-like isoform X2 n=1 Tax=Myxine glutinosa TaxID=7769 RepID=UPI00358EAD5B